MEWSLQDILLSSMKYIRSFRFLIFNIVLIYGITALFSQENYNAQYYKNKGDTELTLKNRMGAINYYNKSIQKNPDYVPALLALSAILHEIGSSNEAKEYLNKAKKIDKNNINIYRLLVQINLDENDLNNAQNNLNDAFLISKNDADLNYLQSEIYFKFEKYYLAETKLKSIIKINPGHALSRILLARIYIDTGRLELAEKELEKSRLIDPENPYVMLLLAENSFQKVMVQQQADIFENKISISDIAPTIAILNNLLEYDPGYIPANLTMAKLYLLFNECDKARDYLDRVLNLNSNNISAKYFSSHCNPKDSMDVLAKILKFNENNEIVRYYYEHNLITYSSRRENNSLLDLAREHYSLGKSLFMVNLNKQAVFEISWASYLYPSYYLPHEELLKYYRSKKDYVNMYEELDYLRRVSDNSYYKDFFELMIEKRREKQFYKEGIVKPEELKTLTPLVVFQFKPLDLIGNYPNAGEAVAEKLTFALRQSGKVNVLSQRDHDQLYAKLNKNSLINGLFFNSQNSQIVYDYYQKEYILKDNSPSREFAKYIVDGSFQELTDGISVTASIIDLQTGHAIATKNVTRSGRGYLRNVALLLADFVYENIPFQGKLIKISNQKILINLGSRDGITEKTKLKIERNGNLLFKAKVTTLDLDILWAETENITDIYSLQAGDHVLIDRD